MFGGQFSLNRFSLRRERSLNIRLITFFTERINVVIGIAKNIEVENNFRENINASVIPTRGFNGNNDFEENVSGQMSGIWRWWTGENNFIETINGQFCLASHLQNKIDFKENINSKIYLVKDIQLKDDFKENISAKLNLSKKIEIITIFKEAVFTSINVDILETETIILTVSIPPGGELRIDSEFFTVTMNDKNIIHQHQGTWINLTRDVLGLAINNPGILNGKLLYTERYL